jgi:hypothetical protein
VCRKKGLCRKKNGAHRSEMTCERRSFGKCVK